MHHFESLERAAREMVRISSGPFVLFTLDPRVAEFFWLSDYFPEIFADAYRLFPALASVQNQFAAAGRSSRVIPFPLPHDLQDCFLAAPWRRPHLYLDADVRGGMSGFAS